MDPIHKQNITGFIDSDSDVKYIQNGDYREAKYLENGDANTAYFGVAETIPGLRKVENPFLLGGTHVNVGSVKWTEKKEDGSDREQVILLFMDTDNLAQHAIQLFDIPTETFTRVLQDPILNFQDRIKHIDIINGVLYFTDGYFVDHSEQVGIKRFNSTRAINIQKCIDFTAGTGGYTGPIRLHHIEAVKYPPAYPPTCAYTTDAAEQRNNLYGKGFKFTYRYIYENNETSKWSPCSKMAIPRNLDTLSGPNSYEPNTDNVIDVNINTGPEIVKTIEVAFGGERSNDNFYVFEILDKEKIGIANDTGYVVRFYNDKILDVVAPSELPYDLMPDVAKTQVVLPNSNVIAYANIEEGFDNVDTDISIDLVRTEILNHICAYPRVHTHNISGLTVSRVVVSFCSWTAPAYSPDSNNWGYAEGDILQAHLSLNPSDNYFAVYYEITAADITAMAALSFILQVQYLSEKIGDAVETAISGDGITILGSYWDGTPSISFGWNIEINNTELAGFALVDQINDFEVIRKTKPIPTLSPGKKAIGLLYLERASRDGTVQHNPDTDIIYVPHESEDEANRAAFVNPTNSPYTITPRITVSHRPPLYATHYAFVVPYRFKPTSFQRRPAYRIDTDPLYPGLTRITLCRGYHDANPKMDISVGDQVRVTCLGRKMVLPNPPFWGADNEGYNENQLYYDFTATVTIRHVLPTGGIDGLEGLITDPLNIRTGKKDFFTIIDIFRAEDDIDTNAWTLISEVFPILQPHTDNRRHKGLDSDQTADLTTPAVSHLSDYGDLWLRSKTYRSELPTEYYNYADGDRGLFNIMTKDPHYSDFYDSPFTNQDQLRLCVLNPYNKRERLETAIVHSEALIYNSRNNGLSSFLGGKNRKLLNITYGPINAMVQKEGSVITVLQTNKETSWYVNQTFGLAVDTNTPSYSSEIFGSMQPMKDGYGCMHPDTIVKTSDGQLIYFDFYRSCFVRSTGAGQYNISGIKQKFNKYSQGLRQEIVDTESRLMAWYDQKNETYLCSVKTSKPWAKTENRILVYKTQYDRWKRVDDYDVVNGGNHGNFSYVFSAIGIANPQDMYVMNQGVENDFFNSVKETVVKIAINPNPTNEKIYKTFGLQGRNIKEFVLVPEILVDRLPAGLNNQRSLIYNESFIEEQGAVWADFKGDIDTPAPAPYFGNTNYMLANGDELRGFSLEATILIKKPTQKVTIDAILISLLHSNPRL